MSDAVEPLDLDERRLQFARELADPDWSLSVPEPAKAVLRDLLAEVERLHVALTTARPTCCDPTTVRERIDGHHLVEEHQHHTCGAGPGSGAGHEPGCGLVPLVDLRGLPGWNGLIATARRDALTEAADWLEAMVSDDGPGNRNTGYGQAGLHIIARLRDRAAQEEGR